MAMGFGGAIESSGGTLAVRYATFTNNRATGGTTTSGPAGPGVGGGIALNYDSTSLSMDHCTVSGNTAAGGPGGGGRRRRRPVLRHFLDCNRHLFQLQQQPGDWRHR